LTLSATRQFLMCCIAGGACPLPFWPPAAGAFRQMKAWSPPVITPIIQPSPSHFLIIPSGLNDIPLIPVAISYSDKVSERLDIKSRIMFYASGYLFVFEYFF
ncbi:hypothetical protein, partial [Pseudomonas savastanoi]|uniref:hypothetical protein n=1 Tax=Pseudomonas savastanoi TaxID=29438 RepID=UPI0016054132